MNATNTATPVAPAAEHDSLGLVHALHTSFHRIVTVGAAPHVLRLLASQIHFALAICQHEEVALRNLLTKVESKIQEIEHADDGIAEFVRRGVVIPQ